MSAQSAELVLSASPANRASSSSVLLRTGSSLSVVFGSGKQLASWDPTSPQRYPPRQPFRAHQADITVLKNLDCHPSAVVSGDFSGIVLVSLPLPDHRKILARLTGLNRSISCLSSIRLPKNNPTSMPDIMEDYLILAGASDGCLITWKISINSSSGLAEHIETLQTIQLNNQIALDAAIAFLPNQFTHLILALAVTDGKIAIYSLALPSLLFSFSVRLPGHTDWVRCLDLIVDPNQSSHLLLVSGSQDHFIRIWRCEELHPLEPTPAASRSTSNSTTKIDDPFESLNELAQTLKEQGQLTENLETGRPRQTVEMKRYSIKDTSWSFVSDALLYGHEGWITNIHWCINPTGSLQLLSTSSDRSMIMWRPSEQFDNVWLNVERFGELATSTNLGFFGAHYFVGPHDRSETVLASGWTRAWHRWSKVDNKLVWDPQIAPTAHYAPVTGLDWEKEGDYLASCSADQTTRIWGSWRSAQNDLPCTNLSWHEICRPQVHGHDLFGISFIGDRRTQFASISEEKVIRVFDMTQDFVQLTRQLGVLDSPLVENSHHPRPGRAIVPILGLSNRVQESTDDSDQAPNQLQVSHQSCPPFEDQLLTRTLWPEIDKIYGHPSELSTITSMHCGQMIASACQASTAQTASIRLHRGTGTFGALEGGTLEAHQLTVTRLAFNCDGTMLLSVSRDRSWTVWRAADGFAVDGRLEKAHTRVIWDADWAPASSHPPFFITGSRDKSVKTWVQAPDPPPQSHPARPPETNKWTLAGLIKCDQPVKSCTISPHLWNHDQLLLAIGLEDGLLGLYSSNGPDGWQCLNNIDLSMVYHEGPINRITFSPKVIHRDGRETFRVATGGEDGVVKVFDLIL